ncbi:hypothetical protein GCM10007420_21350 [Glycocaulis albus]|uniref:Uncharacterized protein n=1 Tax=Glycocaulis albus TaxID=1382801 RepID=A0ABQ1XVQ1_9PROT|nr:hypothetical protein GCM10007420_21350 [Glycocaulis albus]
MVEIAVQLSAQRRLQFVPSGRAENEAGRAIMVGEGIVAGVGCYSDLSPVWSRI